MGVTSFGGQCAQNGTWHGKETRHFSIGELSELTCGDTERICGIRTRLDDTAEPTTDDIGIMGVYVKCCPGEFGA